MIRKRQVGKGKSGGITVAAIQEGEKEKQGHQREKMPVEFPQEFLLVDPIPTLLRRVIGVGLLDFCPCFLVGRGWREKRGKWKGG